MDDQRPDPQPLAIGQESEFGDFGNINQMLGLDFSQLHLHEQVGPPGENPRGRAVGLQKGNRLGQASGLMVGEFLG